MKIATAVTALLSSLAPAVFAADVQPKPGAGLPTEDYHYGMKVDVQKILYRTDVSDKRGVVPVIMVFTDSQGETHKMRFLEWGGRYDG
ncbi:MULTISPECIES: DUF2790 domain-containing protein [Pseudomonas]|uniref:DUF2790 domain-containing protein n=2 Tax=Pseudomonadaceae TaxID=135621 RepID=A0A0D0JX68_9PSED|nr:MULTISPECIES: DUF2790 domain-containing protein [Pseudomonas]KIP90884.1 hypothetical protein RU08_22660 [Pseudomonas fulva]MCW2291700.1 hypothetical protein [Pseudomonas sp. BIGb0408]NYH73729.1 hypothetical protein [Pseudomonas flavescens]